MPLALICVFCFCAPADLIQEARQLAWQKQFAAAEKLYREALLQSPRSRDAVIGLAQVLLWEGRYREARRLFRTLPDDINAAEGAATAAYWQGDYRTAEREFAAISVAHPERSVSVKSLAEIRGAGRGDVRLLVDGVRDDQPYRAWRSGVTMSSFSDPLTRWDVAAGGYHIARVEPFVTISNETALPWHRLTVTTMAGVLRWPDGVTRPIGSLAFKRRLTSNAAVTISAEHRELLTNSTAVQTHPAVTRLALAWSRFAQRGWLAGAEAGHNRYFDENSGGYVQGYALWPVLKRQTTTLWIGASAAARNTSENRFELDAMSSTRLPDGTFAYHYRGSYRNYWTPVDYREARAIVTIAQTLRSNVELKAQAERGVARDEARAFGPSAGVSPVPSGVFAFDFRRTFHPYRISAGASLAISPAMKLQCDIERTVTSFYRANGFRAILVRSR